MAAGAALLALLAFTIGAAVGDGGPLSGLFGEGEQLDVGMTVVTGVQALRELTTVEAVEFTTLTAEDDRGLLDFALGDEIRLLAVARVRAGVDLAELDRDDVTVDEVDGSIRVVLPAPTIQSVALDNEATRVYSRDTGLITEGDDQLESEARRSAERILREQALESDILEEAEREAVLAVEELLAALGYVDIDVDVQR